jgi:hypothetical protein
MLKEPTFTLWNMKDIKIIKNSVPASQKPYSMSPLQRPVSNTVREIIAVDARNFTKHKYSLWAKCRIF